MSKPMTDWGLNMYALSRRYGITQDQLAKEYGCTRTFLSGKLLRSERVKPCTREKLEAALERLITATLESNN